MGLLFTRIPSNLYSLGRLVEVASCEVEAHVETARHGPFQGAKSAAFFQYILPRSELGLYGSSKKTRWTDEIGNEIGYKKSGQMRSCWHIKIATHLMCYTVGVP